MQMDMTQTPNNGGVGEQETRKQPAIYFLDIGLGSNVINIADTGHSGRVLRMTADGGVVSTLVTGLKCPDGLEISPSTGRMFWTLMGSDPSERSGAVMSANLDGSDIAVVIPEGAVHTAKQITVDEETQKLYFCDREGLGVHRCDFNGDNHEVLVHAGDVRTSDREDKTRFCVGIAVDTTSGKFYWTQKGPSKAGQGRILRANITMPDGEDSWNRTDIEEVFSGLPEPIDLEIDGRSQTLYWTDRGEHPTGCTLNKAYVGVSDAAKAEAPTVVARHFHEPIGLKIWEPSGHVYVADLGGSVYRFNLDGTGKHVILSDDGTYTGLTLCIE